MSKRLCSIVVLFAAFLCTAACQTHNDWNRDSNHQNNTRGEADTGQLGHATDTSAGAMHAQ